MPAALGGRRGGPGDSEAVGDLAYGEMLKTFPRQGWPVRHRAGEQEQRLEFRTNEPGLGFGQDVELMCPALPALCLLCRDRQSCCPCSGCRARLRHGGSGACGERDQSSSRLSLGRVFLSLIVNRFD